MVKRMGDRSVTRNNVSIVPRTEVQVDIYVNVLVEEMH
jgi:hypothetical protein